MVFERPPKPGQSTQRPSPTARPKKKRLKPKGKRGGSGSNNTDETGGSGNLDEPSPWLGHRLDPIPNPDETASFIEYLRWMRSPDSEYKDPTKIQILQMATEWANYRERLTQLTRRTEVIAGKENCFRVTCPWRIRVGGHRGPENILLPAFDSLGMPYIPASTLRGAARAEGIRSLMAKKHMDREKAEETIATYFGSLEADSKHREGKVIFLDAYPLPSSSGLAGGLAVDIANNIWNWDRSGEGLLYSPNPSAFYSLKEVTFLIGIRATTKCAPDSEIFQAIRQWLETALRQGIGSQVNTGYGGLVGDGQIEADSFLTVEFNLEGQLIHGHQRFTKWSRNKSNQGWQPRGQAEPEVRPVAFKSMLRYWFRAFCLGRLPAIEVNKLEGEIFGSINPQTRGCLKVSIENGRLIQREARPNYQGMKGNCGEQAGILQLTYSPQIPTGTASRSDNADLLTALTWMMFHLGGVGQGARRPCYSRQNRTRAPWWRGSTLLPDESSQFWQLPDTVPEFQLLFQQRLQDFYSALKRILQPEQQLRPLQTVGLVSKEKWFEAVDSECHIVVCGGTSNSEKPYALSVLHHQDFKLNGDYDGNLCGQVHNGVKPSPVWICDLNAYQVVTIFGATHNPRKKYLAALKARTDASNFRSIFPLQ